MAYEVIKRVSGRAYRYRVESYRDPVTRRVRGKWTYLGRVEGEGTLSPERKLRPNSQERLIEAVERLLETHDVAQLSTGAVAQEAGLAYGTFYRYFRDLAHIVREAMLRRSAVAEQFTDSLGGPAGTATDERAKIRAWVRASIAAAEARPGLFRAWHVTSNQDPAVVAERQQRSAEAVAAFTAYFERLNAAGICTIAAPEFSAYAIVALVAAAARECAIERGFAEAKLDGILAVVLDVAGL